MTTFGASDDPMTPAITREDLRELAADLKQDFRDGLNNVALQIGGLTVQVKETNGRVRTLESGAAVANQRITSLEKETFRRWNDPPQLAVRASDTASDSVVIPKKYFVIATSIGAGVGAMLLAMIQAWWK